MANWFGTQYLRLCRGGHCSTVLQTCTVLHSCNSFPALVSWEPEAGRRRKQPRNSAKPSETWEKQAAFSQIPGCCWKESRAWGTASLPECTVAMNLHACTLSAPLRWSRHQHVCGPFPEASQHTGMQECTPHPINVPACRPFIPLQGTHPSGALRSWGTQPTADQEKWASYKITGELCILGLKGKGNLSPCAGLTLVSMPAITACTQRLSSSTRAQAAVLHHYRTGESTAPGGPAAFQADKKRWKQTCGSSWFPSKCCAGGTMTHLSGLGHS